MRSIYGATPSQVNNYFRLNMIYFRSICSAMQLSPRQQDAFSALSAYIKKTGYSPTSRELGTLLGVSQTAAQNLLTALLKKGAINRLPGQARTITLAQ